MTCHEIRYLLPAFISKEMVGQQKTQLKKHLQNCHDCRNALAKLKKPVTSSKNPPKAEPAEVFSETPAVTTKPFKLPQAEPIRDLPERTPASGPSMLPQTKPIQNLPGQPAVKGNRSGLSLAAFALFLATGLAVFLVFFPNPSNKPVLEFPLRSEKPMEAQKVILELVELLDGTLLSKKEPERTPADPGTAQIAAEEVLLISIPARAQDFLFEKLRALGNFESVSPMGQPSGGKPDDSSMVTLQLAMEAFSPVPQQK